MSLPHVSKGYAVAQLVEALRYMSRVAGSIPDGVSGLFHWHNPSGRTMALATTQRLTEMSTRNISWGLKAAVRRADNLTNFMCRLSWNLGAWTSWNPQGLSRPVIGLLYLYPHVSNPESSSSGRRLYVQVRYSVFHMHQVKQYVRILYNYIAMHGVKSIFKGGIVCYGSVTEEVKWFYGQQVALFSCCRSVGDIHHTVLSVCLSVYLSGGCH